MIGALKDLRDRVRGAGAYAITVPPMDGVLRPNNDLEQADVLAHLPDPGSICEADGVLWVTSGAELCRVTGAGVETVRSFASPITAMTVGPAGPLVVCADGQAYGLSLDGLPETAWRCVTAVCPDGQGGVLVAVGSLDNSANAWVKDLMERRNSGSVWRVKDGKATCLAKGLAWPAGLLSDGDGVLVTEASRARLIRIAKGVSPVLTNLPGYPAGLVRASEGGFFLTVMAPRNQLIEFILRERDFVREMIATTDPAYWIAPSLYPPTSFLEPLQGGALKQLGIMKPWAPSRSIGLVIHLNADFIPTRSHHSRADGRNHGTTACAEWQGALIVASRGNNRLLRLPLTGGAQ
jgi:hypothetical protein